MFRVWDDYLANLVVQGLNLNLDRIRKTISKKKRRLQLLFLYVVRLTEFLT